MGEFGHLNEVITNAVRNSSYITVLISSGIFILYTLIIKLVELFKAKDRNKPLIEMANAIREISINVEKLNNVLNKTFETAEVKESQNVENIITLACDSWKFDIIRYCHDVIRNNNIEVNSDLIRKNISKYISTEYYKLYSLLSNYEIRNSNISSKLKQEWIDELINECVEVVFNGNDPDTRINQIVNRINVLISEYCVYIMNKVFNR